MMYLSNFRIARPPYQIRQEKSFEWLASEFARANQGAAGSREFQVYLNLIQKVGAKPSKIMTRNFYLKDYDDGLDTRLFFSEKTYPTGAKSSVRMKFFDYTATEIFSELFQNDFVFDDLIHVTCTGYVSPSPAQKMVLNKKLHEKTRVHHAYHMGCYAALPALYLADAMAAKGRQVEICHTELCTLHLNTESPSLEQIVVQTLFADGACAYSAGVDHPGVKSLRLLSLQEELIPNSLDAMTWSLSEVGMAMTLSQSVPVIVKNALADFLTRWLGETVNYAELLWAIHPGGPKIIDEIQKIFELREDQVAHSKKILLHHGNMSSATLPHIWNEVLLDSDVQVGQKVITMAFGPGLTISAGLFEVC